MRRGAGVEPCGGAARAAEQLGDAINTSAMPLVVGPPRPGPLGPSGGCYLDKWAVSYKYAPGNVFPDTPTHRHGLRLTDAVLRDLPVAQELLLLLLVCGRPVLQRQVPLLLSEDRRCKMVARWLVLV